jgi:pSer/pThr/pTyr-binding forkhead associated (FHA) protein
MNYVEIEMGEGERTVPLSGDHLSIGRLSYNDISLPSPQISRQHAELRCIDGAWWIVDLNSTNGLHLHGKRIQEHKLTSGDRVVLAPNVTIRFFEEPSPASAAVSSAVQPTPALSSRDAEAAQRRSTSQGTPKIRRTAGFTASDDSERRTTYPVGRLLPSSGQVYPPLVPPGPMLPEKPRSIYSDDEVPYVPSNMAPPTPPPDSLSPYALDSQGSPSPPSTRDSRGPATTPYSSWKEGSASSPPPYAPPQRESGIPQPSNNWNAVADLYAVAGLPPSTATPTQDPYVRSQTGLENDPVGGRESSTLLHVCQTCGQLTSPESVYCQNCHQSIAHECSNCRLSLLPIQERCPRCHTPNDASVRRAHSGR